MLRSWTPSPAYHTVRSAPPTPPQSITLYQAYSAEIALPAVQQQRLSASPYFSLMRMTWIKPSWCWMMYRSGYSHKDANQAHILALTMTHVNFAKLLSEAVVMSNHAGRWSQGAKKKKEVRVQWDPERDYRLGVLPYRSIQIGISGEVGRRWEEEWIERIEDVTQRARELKRVADEEEEDISFEELVSKGLVPVERDYPVSAELRKVLEMDI